MSAPTIPGLEGNAPTTNQDMLNWIAECAELCQPDKVVFCDGSDEEWEALAKDLVDKGTLVKLNEEKRPNSYLASSDLSLIHI